GTPEAHGVVEETRPTFTESIAVITPEQLSAVLNTHPLAPMKEEGNNSDEPSSRPDVDVDIDIDNGTAAGPVARSSGPSTSPGYILAADPQARRMPIFHPETAGAEPTLADVRLGRSMRLFWLWFATNSSVISVALGAVLMTFGTSLRQAVVAAMAGVALSFLPLGLPTLASRWTGQPTIVISRAVFGHVGNLAPALLSLITRVFWGAVLLWFLAFAAARIAITAGLGGVLVEQQLVIVFGGVGFLAALIVAYFGYALLARVQLTASILSAVLILVFIVATSPHVDVSHALSAADGPWTAVLGGTILVFSYVGLAWATSGGDLARYQRPTSSGAKSMIAAPLGSAIPAFILIAYGSLLAGSDDMLAVDLVARPFEALVGLVPPWLVWPLVAAVVIGLFSSVVLSLYSGAFALQTIVVPLRREAAVIVVAVAVAILTITVGMAYGDFGIVFRDLATTLAVPTAAWAGIFAAEIMIRNRRFDTSSLVLRGGLYPDVRWLNVTMLVVATIVGLGLTTADAAGLAWQGYLMAMIGVQPTSAVAGTDFGVLVALGLGIATPLLAGMRPAPLKS
ncbi:MAG: hypothetical protein JWP30_119, partial [Homoserinimonas sp.]|nr:hypothetical protein [Homoserinimonas sp.]